MGWGEECGWGGACWSYEGEVGKERDESHLPLSSFLYFLSSFITAEFMNSIYAPTIMAPQLQSISACFTAAHCMGLSISVSVLAAMGCMSSTSTSVQLKIITVISRPPGGERSASWLRRRTWVMGSNPRDRTSGWT